MPNYIDRDELLRVLQDGYNSCAIGIADGNKYLNSWTAGYENCIIFTKHMPTADVEKIRHAKWVHYGEDVQCSNCGHVSDDICYEGDMDTGYYTVLPHYCSNCGAKMDLEDE